MAKTLTRSELYELIWSRPRSTLSKELGISDVAIGKHCVRAHIPGPPPGYWARSKSAQASIRPALPLRMPGQSDEFTFGDPDRQRYWNRAEDLNEPLVPPVFAEDIELQLGAAMKEIGRITASKDPSSPHSSLKRLLSAEARRREQFEKERFGSYYKPYFDAPHHQRQLRLFSSISHALGRIYSGHEVYCRDEWVQGHGTLHFLRLRIHCGDTYMDLEILEPTDIRVSRKDKGVAVTTLRVGAEEGELGRQEWLDQPGKKLERQLETIVRAMLERAERALRANAQWKFERRVERRKEMLEEIETAKREKERKRLEAIAAHYKNVRQEVLDLAQQRRTANDIREVIDSLSSHPDLARGDTGLFEQWKTEAIKVADMLDPMARPLSELLKNFRSSPDAML